MNGRTHHHRGLCRRRLAALVLGVLAVAAWAGGAVVTPAHAAVNRPPIWESVTPGFADGYDTARALSVDAGGSLYMTGYLYTEATHTDDITTTRWDDAPDGWARVWNGASSLADGGVDIEARAGGVYVGGWSAHALGPLGASDFAILKYTPAGGTAAGWPQMWGATADWDVLGAIAVDGDGNVVAAGTTTTPSDVTVITIVKYDAAGAFQWVQQLNPPSGDYQFGDLYVSPAGVVYVAGRYVPDGGSARAFVASLQSTGDERWKRYCNLAATGNDQFDALCRCPAGGVYAVGRSSSGGHRDGLLARYTAAGARTLARRYGRGDGRDQAFVDAAVDPDRRLAVCGTWGRPDADFYVALLRPTGTVVWSHAYDQAAGADEATCLAIDGRGRVCAGGTVANAAGMQAVAVRTYTRAGVQRWYSKWWYAIPGFKRVCDIACGGSSNVWICGSVENGAADGEQLALGWAL